MRYRRGRAGRRRRSYGRRRKSFGRRKTRAIRVGYRF